MNDYKSPLPLATSKKMFDEWIRVIRRHECASIISLPKFDRHYRVAQFLSEREDFLKSDTECHMISFQSLVSEEAAEFIARLESLKSKKRVQTIFFVLDGEWLLTAAPHLIPSLQQYVLEPYRSTSFIFFFEHNLFSSHYSSFVTQAPSLVQNVVHQKLYAPQDMDHFLQHMAKLYGFSVSEKDRLDIISQTGGYIWLATEALRNIHTTGKISFEHEAMSYRLDAVWNGFSNEERELLANIANGKSISHLHQSALQYFTRCGLVDKRNQTHTLTVPLLNTYVEKEERRYNILTFDNNTIILRGVPINSAFSTRERGVLTHFLNHPNQLISRDLIAGLFWGNDEQEEYSDWSLDQAISRLRTKCAKLGVVYTIKTIKGQGYKAV